MKEVSFTIIDNSHDFQELLELWDRQEYAPLKADEKHFIADAPKIFKKAPFVVFVMNLRTKQFEFISNSDEILGYNSEQLSEKGLSIMNDIIHPEDIIPTWRLLREVWKVILEIPAAKRTKLKFNYDYRIVKPCGKEIRILEQNALLQQDSKGNITHYLGFCTEITNWKESGKQIASITTSENNSIMLFPSGEKKICLQKSILSKRELEILKLMALGNSSKVIADKLSISFHTVNTHRQHMIEKTGCKNTGELIKFSISHELI